MSFLMKVERELAKNSFKHSEFKQTVTAKYRIVEQLKSITKNALKKATLGLIGLGLFSSTLMANPNKANNVALKYQNSLQQLLKEEGSSLDIKVLAKKLGGEKYVLNIKLLDKGSKDYALISVIKLGDAFQNVEYKTYAGSDGTLDFDVNLWGNEIYKSWAASVRQSN
jgi:hypothetical protein